MPFSIRPFRSLVLAYFWGLWLLIALLVLSTSPAYAEWVSVVIVDTTTVYVDQSTIHRNGELVKVWVLADFARANTSQGIISWSATSQEEYDCTQERTRTVALTYFSGPMGSGKVNYSDLVENKWGPVAPGSVAQLLLRVVCRKQ